MEIKNMAWLSDKMASEFHLGNQFLGLTCPDGKWSKKLSYNTAMTILASDWLYFSKHGVNKGKKGKR